MFVIFEGGKLAGTVMFVWMNKAAYYDHAPALLAYSSYATKIRMRRYKIDTCRLFVMASWL